MTRREFRKTIIFHLYLKDLLGEYETPKDQTKDVYLKVLNNIEEVDDVISNNLYNYTVNRLSYLDRSIIRYATYEMLFTNTPKAIIINEAIELTKEFSDIDDLQRAFNNRLLDNIKKSLGE